MAWALPDLILVARRDVDTVLQYCWAELGHGLEAWVIMKLIIDWMIEELIWVSDYRYW